MGNSAQAGIDFAERVGDGLPAVNINWRAEAARDFRQRNALAKDFAGARGGLAPEKMRRVLSGIRVLQSAAGLGVGAHFTFRTTRVRSSDKGALCENQS